MHPTIPQHWKIKNLGEVCEIYQPKTISKKEMVENGGFPVFGANGIIGKYDKYNHENSELLITCRGATCGSVNVSLPKSWINGNAMVIREKNTELLLKKYLEYFFRGANLSEIITGSAQPQITRLSLSPLSIPLPPLPEQIQIVKILDEAFEKIETAKHNTEKNLKNAKELFESYLQNIFEEGKNDDEWEEKIFSNVCTLQRGFDLPKKQREKGVFPLVSSNGITDFINLKKVDGPGVVTGRSGTIGKVHFVENDFWPLNTALYIKNFCENDQYFIFYFLKQFKLEKYKSGAGVPTLNRNHVHSEIVSIPKTINTQQKIVAQLDSLSAKTKQLETHYQKKLGNLDELKKSLLQKAFCGEL